MCHPSAQSMQNWWQDKGKSTLFRQNTTHPKILQCNAKKLYSEVDVILFNGAYFQESVLSIAALVMEKMYSD